jgi:hypothetical protein
LLLAHPRIESRRKSDLNCKECQSDCDNPYPVARQKIFISKEVGQHGDFTLSRTTQGTGYSGYHSAAALSVYETNDGWTVDGSCNLPSRRLASAESFALAASLSQAGAIGPRPSGSEAIARTDTGETTGSERKTYAGNVPKVFE